MTATAAYILSVIIVTLFALAGLLAGVFWRKHGFKMNSLLRGVGIVATIVGVWLTFSQTKGLAEWSGVRNWPSIDGVVVASRVAGERAYHPEIVYQYTVNGTTYSDSTSFDTPSFGGRSVKREVAEVIVAKFPPGSTVAVHYDPQVPSRSLLRLSPDWSVYGKIGLGGTLLGLGLFLMVAARRTRP